MRNIPISKVIIAADQSLACLMPCSKRISTPCSDGSSRDSDAASAQDVGGDEANAGMAARARVSLDRVERHRLPAALLVALLAGCGCIMGPHLPSDSGMYFLS